MLIHIKNTFNFISPLVLFILGVMNPISSDKNIPIISNAFYMQIYSHKINIAIFFFIIYLATIFFNYLLNKKNKYIEAVLKIVLARYGGSPNFRITLYKRKKGYQIAVQYFFRCQIFNYPIHSSKGLILYYHKNRIRFFKDYLVVYYRLGQPLQNGSSTFFLLAESDDNISGIVPYCSYTEKSIKVSFPELDVEQICSYKSLNDMNSNPELKKAVEAYMHKGKIKNFDDLRRFHFFPKHMWLNPMYNSKEEPWGVISLESKHDQSPFEAQTGDELIEYCKVIQGIIRQHE